MVSNEEFGTGSNHDLSHIAPSSTSSRMRGSGSVTAEWSSMNVNDSSASWKNKAKTSGSDAVEIWDVRRGWIAKWSVTGSAAEGGVTGSGF